MRAAAGGGVLLAGWLALLATGCGEDTRARAPDGPGCLQGRAGLQACGFGCLLGADGVPACANTVNGLCILDGRGRAVCSQLSSAAGLLANAPPPRCLQGVDGRTACGWDCQLDARGRAACANTPDGLCQLASDGHLTCTHLVPDEAGAVTPPPAPECLLGAEGSAACGYNCELGADGRPFCSSLPTGRCAPNPDGSLTCP